MLKGPEFPEVLRYLWEWFTELERARSVGPHGVNPMSYQDIDAWARLLRRPVLPHEVSALMRLDLVMRHPDPRKKSKKPGA